MTAPSHELQAFGPQRGHAGEETQRTLSVPDNANLAEVALREALPLYGFWGRLFNCGGKGKCRSCFVVIRAGSESCSPPTPMERHCLPNAGPGERLGCQVQVRGPISVSFKRPLPPAPDIP